MSLWKDISLEHSDSNFEDFIDDEPVSLVFFKDSVCDVCRQAIRVIDEVRGKASVYIVDIVKDRDFKKAKKNIIYLSVF